MKADTFKTLAVISAMIILAGCAGTKHVSDSGGGNGNGGNAPLTADDFVTRGILFAVGGEYDSAVADFSAAVEKNPGLAAAYALRARVIYREMCYSERCRDSAIADYSQAILLNPDYAAAYTDRGNLYREASEYDKAIADFNQAVKLEPDNAETYYNRGETYIYKKDRDSAIADYSKAIELKPDYADAYYRRGLIYHRKDEDDLAIKDFETVLRINPKRYGAEYELKNILDNRERKKTCEIEIALAFREIDSAQTRGQAGAFTDKRDGKTYRTVVMPDGKTWMAENLNYQTGTDSSRCYGGDTSNCEKYGGLYTWSEAAAACPAGWRLPSNDDWDALINAAGGRAEAGKKLKSRTEWRKHDYCYIPGTDNFGFSAKPGGFRRDGGFTDAGASGYWWSAAEYDADNAGAWGLLNNQENVYSYWSGKGGGFSVRCLR